MPGMWAGGSPNLRDTVGSPNNRSAPHSPGGSSGRAAPRHTHNTPNSRCTSASASPARTVGIFGDRYLAQDAHRAGPPLPPSQRRLTPSQMAASLEQPNSPGSPATSVHASPQRPLVPHAQLAIQPPPLSATSTLRGPPSRGVPYASEAPPPPSAPPSVGSALHRPPLSMLASTPAASYERPLPSDDSQHRLLSLGERRELIHDGGPLSCAAPPSENVSLVPAAHSEPTAKLYNELSHLRHDAEGRELIVADLRRQVTELLGHKQEAASLRRQLQLLDERVKARDVAQQVRRASGSRCMRRRLPLRASTGRLCARGARIGPIRPHRTAAQAGAAARALPQTARALLPPPPSRATPSSHRPLLAPLPPRRRASMSSAPSCSFMRRSRVSSKRR